MAKLILSLLIITATSSAFGYSTPVVQVTNNTGRTVEIQAGNSTVSKVDNRRTVILSTILETVNRVASIRYKNLQDQWMPVISDGRNFGIYNQTSNQSREIEFNLVTCGDNVCVEKCTPHELCVN